MQPAARAVRQGVNISCVLAGRGRACACQNDKGWHCTEGSAAPQAMRGAIQAPLDGRRWRTASNRQTPVATETLRLLTLPPIGRRAK